MNIKKEPHVGMYERSFINTLKLSRKQRIAYTKVYDSTLDGKLYYPNYYTLATEMDCCERGAKCVMTTLTRKKLIEKVGQNSYRAIFQINMDNSVTKKGVVEQYLNIGTNANKSTKEQITELNALGFAIDKHLFNKYKWQLNRAKSKTNEAPEEFDNLILPHFFFNMKFDTVTEMFLLIIIYNYTVKASGYYMTDNRISEILGVSRKTIIRAKSRLMDKQYMTRMYNNKLRRFVYKSITEEKSSSVKDFKTACFDIGCKTQDELNLMERCLNCAVLGRNRQTISQNELSETEKNELKETSNFFVKAVDNGLITDINGAKTYFRREYERKYTNSLPFNK